MYETYEDMFRYGKAKTSIPEISIVEDCVTFNCLYENGGWLEQPLWFWQMVRIRNEVEQQSQERKNKLTKMRINGK